MTFPTVAAGATAAGTFGRRARDHDAPAARHHESPPRREPQLGHRNPIEVTRAAASPGCFRVDTPCQRRAAAVHRKWALPRLYARECAKNALLLICQTSSRLTNRKKS